MTFRDCVTLAFKAVRLKSHQAVCKMHISWLAENSQSSPASIPTNPRNYYSWHRRKRVEREWLEHMLVPQQTTKRWDIHELAIPSAHPWNSILIFRTSELMARKILKNHYHRLQSHRICKVPQNLCLYRTRRNLLQVSCFNVTSPDWLMTSQDARLILHLFLVLSETTKFFTLLRRCDERWCKISGFR